MLTNILNNNLCVSYLLSIHKIGMQIINQKRETARVSSSESLDPYVGPHSIIVNSNIRKNVTLQGA
jgi:hypothetical protein